jgi:hypothetical protein
MKNENHCQLDCGFPWLLWTQQRFFLLFSCMKNLFSFQTNDFKLLKGFEELKKDQFKN